MITFFGEVGQALLDFVVPKKGMDQVLYTSDLLNLVSTYLNRYQRLNLRVVCKSIKPLVSIVPFGKVLKRLLKKGVLAMKYREPNYVLYMFGPIDFDVPEELKLGLFCKSVVPCYTIKNGSIIVFYKGWVGGISCKHESFAQVSQFLFVPLTELY